MPKEVSSCATVVLEFSEGGKVTASAEVDKGSSRSSVRRVLLPLVPLLEEAAGRARGPEHGPGGAGNANRSRSLARTCSKGPGIFLAALGSFPGAPGSPPGAPGAALCPTVGQQNEEISGPPGARP